MVSFVEKIKHFILHGLQPKISNNQENKEDDYNQLIIKKKEYIFNTLLNHPSEVIQDLRQKYDASENEEERTCLILDMFIEILKLEKEKDFLDKLILMYLFEVEPNFIELKEKLDNLSYVYIKGQIQEGKTMLLVVSCVYCICIQKVLPIIVVDSTNAHYIDFVRKLKYFLTKMKRQLNVDLNVVNYKNISSINDKSIVVTINHFTGLGKIRDYVQRKNIQYNVFIDEADKAKYGGKEEAKSRVILKDLVENSIKSLDCTATSFSLYENEQMTSENIFKMKTHPDYKGIESLTWKHIPEKLTAEKNKKYMLKWAKIISKHKGFNTKNGFHPAIGLFIFDRKIKEHRDFVEICQKRKLKCDFLEYNSSQKNMLAYNGQKIKKSLSDIIQDQNRSLIIVAGDLAGRGISYVSTDFKKHLTHQYLSPSKTATTTITEQNLRILGKYQDDIPLTVICTEKDMNDIKKSHGLNDELAKYCNDDSYIREQIKEIGINKLKMPKRKITNTSNKNITKINGNDGRLQLDVFNEEYNINTYKPGTNATIVIIFPDTLNDTLRMYYKYIVKYLKKRPNQYIPRKEITQYINTKLSTEESNIRAQLTFLQRKGVAYDGNTDGLVFKQPDGKGTEIQVSYISK